MLRGRVVRSVLESVCLKGNPLGDPHVREVLVYLPPDYDESERRYPQVMLLPGFAATHQSMLGWSAWKPNTIERFEQQVLAGETPPALLVMPDAANRWGGSQFVDSAATGRYQTYLCDEVFAHVDSHFRTVPTREGRAVIGRSSGGFGALRIAMDRPETVGAVGSHCGDAAFEVSMRPMLLPAAIAIEQAGGLATFAERVVQGGPRGGGQFDAIFVLACSAAYAPEDGPAPYCALPMRTDTGELIDDAWAKWLAHDPLPRIPSCADALKRMSGIFLDSGDRDEHGLQYAARLMRDAMKTAGVDVHHEEYEGGHRGTSYRYERSLPWLIERLER